MPRPLSTFSNSSPTPAIKHIINLSPCAEHRQGQQYSSGKDYMQATTLVAGTASCKQIFCNLGTSQYMCLEEGAGETKWWDAVGLQVTDGEPTKDLKLC